MTHDLQIHRDVCRLDDLLCMPYDTTYPLSEKEKRQTVGQILSGYPTFAGEDIDTCESCYVLNYLKLRKEKILHYQDFLRWILAELHPLFLDMMELKYKPELFE